MSRARAVSWRGTGLLKGAGIPAPSGPHRVGCVDVAHLFESEAESRELGGLLMRLFYPTDATPEAGGEGERAYRFASWLPDKRYVHGYLDFQRTPLTGLLAKLLSAVVDPKIPALEGAPLLPGRPADETLQQSLERAEGGGDGIDMSQQDEAPPTPKPRTHPLIVFSHGLGGMRTTYSAICCDLASHGYIVASVEHRDRSGCMAMKRYKLHETDDTDDPFSPPSPSPSPSSSSSSSSVGHTLEEWVPFYHKLEEEKEFPLRNKQVHQRCQDVQRAVDLMEMLNNGVEVENLMGINFDLKQFQSRVDMSRVAAMGHSFGGATTIQVLSEDPRVMCGIALDCWMVPIHRDLYTTGISKPLLFINSYTFQWADNVRNMMKLTRGPDDQGFYPCQVMTLEGTNHQSQSDLYFTLPTFAFKIANKHPQLDPVVGHALNTTLCHDFYNRYLLGDPDYQHHIPNLDGGEGAADHLIFGTNVILDEGVAQSEGESGAREGEGSPPDSFPSKM